MSSRPQYHIDLGNLPPLIPNLTPSSKSSAQTSPIERAVGGGTRLPQSGSGSMNAANNAGGYMLGTSSPSYDYGSRLFGKRARELQSADKPSPSMWGPPTASGLSTPLRETIPESPGSDSFPDLGLPASDSAPFAAINKRSRAGTVPSRLPLSSGQQSLFSNTSRPSPTNSPFRPGSRQELDPTGYGSALSANAALMSRLRAGSTPQRSSLLTTSSSPFGSSIFSSNWNDGRDRANSTQSLNAAEEILSPTISKDAMNDVDVKTLDYLGLVDSPQARTSEAQMPSMGSMTIGQRPTNMLLSNVAAMNRNASRFRSYSMNAKEKYAADEDDDQEASYYSGQMTPSAEAAAAALAATQAQIHQHNLDVQAFANQASSSRPRAQTAGVLDSPSSRVWRTFMPASVLEHHYASNGMDSQHQVDVDSLSNAMRTTQLSNMANPLQGVDAADGTASEENTRALWLGGIPPSTTSSSLRVIFESFGPIESVRVLTYKNCGFVNFESLESAARAKAQLNGKDIFPGAGPIRIGFARVPSSATTPSINGLINSGPDAFGSATGDPLLHGSSNGNKPMTGPVGLAANPKQAPTFPMPALYEIKDDILQMVSELGANEEEHSRIAAIVDSAIRFNSYEPEIPAIPDPTPNRLHDAPRLRDIRKRIDNNACSQEEIEDIAMGMLPEIAELSSDYLGNTVVQKLFEHCSESTKEAMLAQISPHIAEIGVHKNGTWAAQKIIDVAKTSLEMGMIIDHLRPYGVSSFLDQYGNYVMQCCLRFQSPWNNFIFEIMLSRLWDVAQGRFGARAMRACLESHYSTKDQQRVLAAAIALHSVHLATNTNGALLLTWFLDTCTFPRRRAVLAPRIIPHLVHLCTHKVAYLTVLKIINQKNEPEARDAIMDALFFSPEDAVLEEILKDHACGATLIFKVLTTPFFDDAIRPSVVQNVRKVLLKLKAQPAQGYKRLMDEVDLSTRSTGGGTRDVSQGSVDIQRSNNKQSHNQHNGENQRQASFERQFSGLYTHHLGAGVSNDSGASYDPYMQPSTNPGNPNMYANALNPSASMELPYQQAYYAAQRQPGGFNVQPGPMQGFGGSYGSPMDAYRGIPPSPMTPQMGMNPLGPHGGYNPQGNFNHVLGMNSGMGNSPVWQQYPNMYMIPPQMQSGGGGASIGSGRRARR